MTDTIDPAQLWLGAFVGAQVLLLFSCVIKANAYGERALLLHAPATLMSVLSVLSMIGRQPLAPTAVLLLVPALAGVQLMDLMSHASEVRQARRWLFVASATRAGSSHQYQGRLCRQPRTTTSSTTEDHSTTPPTSAQSL